MFLEKGFNDYLSKPIEIAKLDEIVSRWTPPEKRIKAGDGIKREVFSGDTGIVIPGVDVKQGITMTGGTETGYRKVLAQFYKDAVERLPVFAALPDETALAAFTTQAHALKSAAGTIGAVEVSKEAAELEKAGKAGDMAGIAAIEETLPKFREHLVRLTEELKKVLRGSEAAGGQSVVKNGGGNTRSLPPTFRPFLLTLKEALEAKNMTETDRLLEKIERLPLDEKTREDINAISDEVLMGEYEKAIASIDKYRP
jgi:HPt (histidine-containing phosphotransfer) domain-containing protein